MADVEFFAERGDRLGPMRRTHWSQDHVQFRLGHDKIGGRGEGGLHERASLILGAAVVKPRMVRRVASILAMASKPSREARR